MQLSQYKRLKELREDHDLTQKQVAEMLYMHVTQYRRCETGEREITLSLAIFIAKLYHVSVDYLAGLTEPEQEIHTETLTAEEKKLLAGYRKLSSFNKGRLQERLQMLTENKN